MTRGRTYSGNIKGDSVHALSLYCRGLNGYHLINDHGYTRHRLRMVSFFVREHYEAANIPEAAHRALQRGDLLAGSEVGPRLTPRLFEVLMHISNGLTYPQMAEEMNVGLQGVVSLQKLLHKAYGVRAKGASGNCRLVWLGHRYGML